MMDYKKAGVDIEAGYKSVELMKEHVKKTMRAEVLGGLGGFSGAFSLAKIKEMEEPVLLSGTDGCGTKVKLAIIMDKHDTIGIDAVAMCVNDIACAGGEPLFFLDYIACGKNYPEKIADIVKGVAEGCLQSEAALIGGETAEHPGLMPEEDYDLAGFAVGVCDKKEMITGEKLEAGDVLIGMASTGVHSNGFSLVRKVFEKEMNKEGLNTYYDSLGKTLGEALLAPTRIYVKALKNIKKSGVTVKACSHITGGGFYENVPRMLKDGVRAVIRKDSYPVPPIFKLLAEKGKIEEKMMYNTFNMGLGMVVAVDDGIQRVYTAQIRSLHRDTDYREWKDSCTHSWKVSCFSSTCNDHFKTFFLCSLCPLKKQIRFSVGGNNCHLIIDSKLVQDLCRFRHNRHI